MRCVTLKAFVPGLVLVLVECFTDFCAVQPRRKCGGGKLECAVGFWRRQQAT